MGRRLKTVVQMAAFRAAGSFSISFTLLFIASATAIISSSSSSSSSSFVSASGGGDHQNEMGLGWLPMTIRSGGCQGTIAECLAAADDDEFDFEFQLDSETNRRILATTRYISYGALQRNTVPCSRRGASYYNCRPGAQANPYSRGCSAITRCRGG